MAEVVNFNKIRASDCRCAGMGDGRSEQNLASPLLNLKQEVEEPKWANWCFSLWFLFLIHLCFELECDIAKGNVNGKIVNRNLPASNGTPSRIGGCENGSLFSTRCAVVPIVVHFFL